MEKQMTAVEWLSEKYNYVTWLRNRDEISACLADEWRKSYLEQAKEKQKQEISDFYEWLKDYYDQKPQPEQKYIDDLVDQYYNETYGK